MTKQYITKIPQGPHSILINLQYSCGHEEISRVFMMIPREKYEEMAKENKCSQCQQTNKNYNLGTNINIE